MKKFTRLFSFILTVVLIVSIFPAATANAAEKKYKLALTGEYNLGDDEKVIYNYNKMMKNIKLEKVEGKNQWNLTMYAGTTVVLPYLADAATDKVKITTASKYVSGGVWLYSDVGGWIEVTTRKKYGQTKTVTNKVLTCKAYNKAEKCLSTLKIVVKILPYNAKLERTKVITAKDLYKLGYHRDSYSDFAWERVVKNYPEILLDDGGNSPIYVYINHIWELDAYGYKVPQYLFDRFGGKNANELAEILVAAEDWKVWGYDEELIEAVKYATSCGTDRYPGQSVFNQLDAIFEELNLEQYTTDWEKILAFQKWVASNIKYKTVNNVSVRETLKKGYTKCSGYANLMCVACQRLGIPCYYVADPDFMGLGHAWNIVLVDGLWCTMDLTGQPCFGCVPTEGFKVESASAVESVQIIFGGGIYREDSSKYWDFINECWAEDTED